jgi:hypothetical protein
MQKTFLQWRAKSGRIPSIKRVELVMQQPIGFCMN